MVIWIFWLKLGSKNLGLFLKKAIVWAFLNEWGLSVNKERPRGEKAINVAFNFWSFCISPSSGYLVESEYSDCTAATLWMLFAFSSELGEISEYPICFTFPDFTKSERVWVTSSIGIFWSRLCT